jgi:hypothetical protein
MRWWIAAILVIVLAGCGRAPIDPKRDLQVDDVTTGWFDAGIVEDRKNKLVPTISFRLKNASSNSIDTVQVNAVFRQVGKPEEWDTAFARAIDANGLAGGSATGPIVLRARLGYTGEQPRGEMLQHRLFVDAKVDLFVKHRAGAWIKLGDYPIRRQLLTQ